MRALAAGEPLTCQGLKPLFLPDLIIVLLDRLRGLFTILILRLRLRTVGISFLPKKNRTTTTPIIMAVVLLFITQFFILSKFIVSII
jgi:hypothetical protein